jgi:uncharacterized membrane protein
MTLPVLLMVIAVAQFIMKLGMSSGAVQASLARGDFAAVAAATLFNPLVVGGLVAYVLGAGLWLFVLSKAELSLVYPFVALGFIMTMLMGAFLLHEAVGTYRVVGTLLIAVGAVLVARS